MCGPVLIGHGTAEQKAHYLPRMLSGEDFWCQGYSEPGSGSDLASLQMSARDDGDHFVCNGHKIWTTHAHVANWIFCLVRTSREKIPQLGITFLLIDMRTPGVDVKPIVSMSGEHIQNEVFFTDVRVPKKNVVGRIGDGWTVAKYLMQFERGGGVSSPGLKVRLERIRGMAEAEGIDDENFATKIAQAAIDIASLEAVELRVMSSLSQGQAPGAEVFDAEDGGDRAEPAPDRTRGGSGGCLRDAVSALRGVRGRPLAQLSSAEQSGAGWARL